MTDRSDAPRRRPWLGAASIAAGLAALTVVARFAFEPADSGPRVFQLGSLFGPGLDLAQPRLEESLTAIAGWRSAWALVAATIGVLGARWSGRRLALNRAGAALFGVGLALTVFTALDPGVVDFVARRGFSGAPTYREVEDLLRGFGVALLALGVGLALGPGTRVPRETQDAVPRRTLWGASAVALSVPLLFSGGVLSTWNTTDLAQTWPQTHRPLTNDGRAYLFQAELFASGRVTTDLGAAAPHFNARQVLAEGGRFASKYPPGHSLLLTPGAWLSSRWPLFGALIGARLLPLLLQAGMPWIVYALARRFGARRPAWAAWLYALSPTPLMLGSMWLAHGTSLPMCALAVLFAVRAIDADGQGERGRALGSAVATGLLLSIAGLARPGTALAVALPLIGALALRPRSLARLGPAAIVAALPALVGFAWINWATTGQASLPAYVRYAALVSPDDRWGLANLAGAPTSLALNGARLSLWLHGFGMSSALAWLGLATYRGRHRALLWSIPAALAGFYALLTFHGLPWAGPLYWVEGFPLLMVLSSEGLATLAERWGRRAVPIALGASALGASILLAGRAPLAGAELRLRTAHEAADAADRGRRSDYSPRVVEVDLSDPLEIKRRFLAPPTELGTARPLPSTVFVVGGARGPLPEALRGRPRYRYVRASDSIVPVD